MAKRKKKEAVSLPHPLFHTKSRENSEKKNVVRGVICNMNVNRYNLPHLTGS